MDAKRDAQGGIQMILGAAEMLEHRGDELSTQRRFSEGDTDSEGEEELAGDMGEPCFDSSDGEGHASEHQPLEEQPSVGWWRETHPWPQRRRSSRGDREASYATHSPDLKREKAVALHNKKEQIRRKELREAIHRLRNQLKRKTKKPSTISVLKAAQHEIRELKCQEAERQQDLDGLNKKKNYLSWRLEKLVSEYNESRLCPPQVQPVVPGSFLHSRQPGDNHLMMPQLPNHTATSTGGTLPAVTAFPPRYLPVPTPPMLPAAPFHFPNSTIPSPSLLSFPPQFFLPSTPLQPPFMMPGSYFCGAPGRFGHPSSSGRLLPTNSMFGLPAAPAMPMLCPQLPILQQHQNMVDSRFQNENHSRRTQKDKVYVPEHPSQGHSPRARHSLSNSSHCYPVINYTTGSTNIPSTSFDSNSCTSEEDSTTREEEDIVDVEQDSPEVDETRLQIQAPPQSHLNRRQVGQRNHSLETQRAIRNSSEASEPDLVPRLFSDEEGSRCSPAQRNFPDVTAPKKTRTDTSPASPCGYKHSSKFPKSCPKNSKDPPQLLRRVNKKQSISSIPSNFHVPSNLPKNLPGPPLLKKSQAETDHAILVSRVMENIRPQRERMSKRVSESALEKFDLNLCNGELGPHQLGPQQRTYNTNCDSLCKEKPNKKNGQIVRVSTEQGQQVACSVF